MHFQLSHWLDANSIYKMGYHHFLPQLIPLPKKTWVHTPSCFIFIAFLFAIFAIIFVIKQGSPYPSTTCLFHCLYNQPINPIGMHLPHYAHSLNTFKHKMLTYNTFAFLLN